MDREVKQDGNLAAKFDALGLGEVVIDHWLFLFESITKYIFIQTLYNF